MLFIGLVIKKIFGTRNERELKKLIPLVDEINSFGDRFKQASDELNKIKVGLNKIKA